MVPLTVFTININKIITDWKLETLKEFIRHYNADVILLQEVATYTIDSLPGYCVITNIDPVTRTGTAMAIRQYLDFSDVDKLQNGRGIACTINGIRTVNVYAPSGGSNATARADYFNHDVANVLRASYDDVILGGDFNCVLAPKDQSTAYKRCPALEQLITCFNLKDTWDHLYPDKDGFTYFYTTGRSRLDRIYVSHSLISNVQTATIVPFSLSDHSGYQISIQRSFKIPRRPRSRWKCNIDHFADDELHCIIQHCWQRCLSTKSQYSNALKWWTDFAKPLLRETLISYSQEKAFWHRQTLDLYQHCLQDAYDMTTMPPDSHLTSIMRIKAKIRRHHLRRSQGTAIRSKPPGYSDTEPASLYHVQRERKRARRLYIHHLVGRQNERITAPNEILNTFYQYYVDLFTPTPIDDDAQEEFLETHLPQLTMEDNDELTSPLTPEEVHHIVSHSNKYKSPGPDGIPIEFYIKFWYILGPHLTDIVNGVLQGIPLPPSFLEGQIVLIHKSGKTHTVDNFRPITLLNADYKLTARCLAYKLKAVLPKIISNRQTCAVPRRNIFEALATYREIIGYAAAHRRQAAILFLDLHKAFDKINHKYLLTVLRAFGFRQAFTEVISRLLTAATSTIIVNGVATKPIFLKNSVRQGCPLSMALFALALDPLLRRLEHGLRGITICGTRNCCIAYADDVGIFTEHQEDFPIIQDILRQFERASGARINERKTVLLPLGAGFPVSDNVTYQRVASHRVLGVHVSNNLTQMAAFNWRNQLRTIRSIAINNVARTLPILGRVHLAHDILYAKAWYLAQVLPPPNLIAASISSAAYWYVWKGEIFKIRQAVCYNEVTNGGLGLIDFRLKCMALFLHRMFSLHSTQTRGITRSLLCHYKPASEVAPVDIRPIPFRLTQIRTYYLNKSYVQDDFYTIAAKRATNIYLALRGGVPQNRLELLFPIYHWPVIWDNIHHKLLPLEVRSTWLKVVNRTLRTRKKMFDIHQARSAECEQCSQEDTLEHRFTCGNARDVWLRATRMLALILRTDPRELSVLTAMFPDLNPFPLQKRNAVVWLLGHTTHVIHSHKDMTRLEYELYLVDEYTKLSRTTNCYQIFHNYLHIGLGIT